MPNWIFNVGVALAVVSYLLLLVGAAILAGVLGAPHWVLTAILVAGFFGLFGVIVGWTVLMDRLRTRAMAESCRALGFTFTEEAPTGVLESFEGLPLFSRGHGRFARNMMRGKVADQRIVVMDFEYSTGSGRTRNHARQTVVVFPDGAEAAPSVAPDSANPPGWAVESAGRLLAAYRPARMCRAARVPAFIADALRVQQALGHSERR